jgi:hypothetical protein
MSLSGGVTWASVTWANDLGKCDLGKYCERYGLK